MSISTNSWKCCNSWTCKFPDTYFGFNKNGGLSKRSWEEKEKSWISNVKKKRCLPIAESRLFPCIHYHQCRVSVFGVGCERLITTLCFLVDSATWNRQLFRPSLWVISMLSPALVERAPSLSPSPTQTHSGVSICREKRSSGVARRVAR